MGKGLYLGEKVSGRLGKHGIVIMVMMDGVCR